MSKLLSLSILILCGVLGCTAGKMSFSDSKAPPAPKGPGEIWIVYSGNTLGELKPCGCAKEEDQGGFERRMSYFKDVRKRAQNLLLVDTGDNFKEPTRQGLLKARFLIEAMRKMQYDAVALGEHDFVYGNELIEKAEDVPWLLSNFDFEQLTLPKFRIKRFPNGMKAAVIAVADPQIYYSAHHAGDQVQSPQAVVQSLVGQLKKDENPDLIVLLTHMQRENARAYLDLAGVDVVVNGHIEKETDTIDMNPEIKDGKILVQPGPRGQKMGELKVTIGKDGKRSFEQKMVRLDSAIPFDPEMVKLYEQYNQEVEALFFESLTARRNKDKKKIYATEKVCQTCHPDQHKIWSASRHGHAYDTLHKINKAFDPECLVCHVTGLNEEGGFISEIDTAELKNVQCEVCHGPALKHSQAPSKGFGLDAKQACKKCHVKNHSPNFNYSTYWPKIRH